MVVKFKNIESDTLNYIFEPSALEFSVKMGQELQIQFKENGLEVDDELLFERCDNKIYFFESRQYDYKVFIDGELALDSLID